MTPRRRSIFGKEQVLYRSSQRAHRLDSPPAAQRTRAEQESWTEVIRHYAGGIPETGPGTGIQP